MRKEMKRNEKETNGNKWKGNEDQVNFSTCLKVRFSIIVFIWFCFFCSFYISLDERYVFIE